MAWTTPSLVEICIGLEINGYLRLSSDQCTPGLRSGKGIAERFQKG